MGSHISFQQKLYVLEEWDFISTKGDFPASSLAPELLIKTKTPLVTPIEVAIMCYANQGKHVRWYARILSTNPSLTEYQLEELAYLLRKLNE